MKAEEKILKFKKPGVLFADSNLSKVLMLVIKLALALFLGLLFIIISIL